MMNVNMNIHHQLADSPSVSSEERERSLLTRLLINGYSSSTLKVKTIINSYVMIINMEANFNSKKKIEKT